MTAELAQLESQLKQSIIEDSDPAPLLRGSIQGGAPRIAIYRLAYRARLAEALAENFPVLKATLGDDRFEALAHAYIAAHPSKSPSIRWFGEHLVEWLEAEPERVGHAALIDLARMEWALGTAFDGPDGATLSVGDLTRIEPEHWPSMRFAPHPCTRLLRLQWGIEPLWKALSADRDAQAEPPAELDHHLLVWRRGHETQWRSVENDEAELLAACLAGEPFETLCVRAARREGEAAVRVAGLLRVWVEAGVLASVTLSQRPASGR